MDLQKEDADVTYDFVLLQNNKPVKIDLDIRKYLDGDNKDVQTIITRIPRNTLSAGRYSFKIYVKDNKSGTIISKTIPFYYTRKQAQKKKVAEQNKVAL